MTNLVFLGTVVIGGLLLAFFAFAFTIVLALAGVGQGIASLLGLALRPFLSPSGASAERTTAGPASADRDRAAVVAKADSILAAQKAAAAASASMAAAAASARELEGASVQSASDEPAADDPAPAGGDAVAPAASPVPSGPVPSGPSPSGPVPSAPAPSDEPAPAPAGPRTVPISVVVRSRTGATTVAGTTTVALDRAG
ncbi:hypothetical protein [Sinomonas halotolerans]|uniref:Uncharacterized protein n=1 Tax=Sinomonas halotolerans TaxID=1644133 RepID=A0ABU9WZA7_9MICC